MLAGRLQRRTTTLATPREDAVRVRLHLPSAPGSGAALCQGLRASSRRSNRPTGHSNRQERTHRWIKLGGNVTHDVERVLSDIDADHGDRGIGCPRHGVLLVFGAPCQLRLLAGQEHGRTIPLAVMVSSGEEAWRHTKKVGPILLLR